MSVNFVWNTQINPDLKASFESKVLSDFREGMFPDPCHTGDVLMSILSCDLLEISLKGNLTCSCGTLYAGFSSASNGSTINYNIPNA